MKLLLFIFSFTGFIVAAQTPTLDVNSSGAGLHGSVKFFDPSAVGKKTYDKMNYSEVRGRYLWDEDWHRAVFTLKGGNMVKVQKVRLSLYTNSVHYIDNTLTEFEAQTGLVRKIIMLSDTDSSKVIATFESLKSEESNGSEFYYEVMNEGKIQLLKRTVANLIKKAYDPSVGKTEYQFSSTTDYLIRQEDTLKSLKKINKNSLYEILLPDNKSENWASNHRNKFRNEEDVVEFLNFLNSASD